MPARSGDMPRFTKAPPEMVARFNDAIRPLMADIERRQMFGYPCAFVGSQMFTGLFQDFMHIRLSAEDRAVFLKLEGARVFEPLPGRPMKEYMVVPRAVLYSEPELQSWLRKSFDYARSLPPKLKKPKASRAPKK